MQSNITTPKVSVIVPIYKVQKYLFQCISSIVEQTLKDIEIILIDEGDDDACYAIMCLFAKKDSRIKIIHQKNGGYGASCNVGIKEARGEYISIIESDDFIEPEMLEEMYQAAKRNNVDIVKTPFYYFSDGQGGQGDIRKVCEYRERISACSPKSSFSILEYPQQMSVHASIWAGLYRTEFMHKNNLGFIAAKGAGYVDVGFRLETFLASEKIFWLDKPFYNYRITNTESSTNQFSIDAMLQRWREAHDLLETKYKDKYASVASELILDEYLNTLGWFHIIPFTEKQTKLLEENLKRVSSEYIESSRALSNLQKKDLLEFKKLSAEGKIDFTMSANGGVPAYFSKPKLIMTSKFWLKLLHFHILLSHNRFEFCLFEGLEKTIFMQEFIIFNKFSILISLGNHR